MACLRGGPRPAVRPPAGRGAWRTRAGVQSVSTHCEEGASSVAGLDSLWFLLRTDRLGPGPESPFWFLLSKDGRLAVGLGLHATSCHAGTDLVPGPRPTLWFPVGGDRLGAGGQSLRPRSCGKQQPRLVARGLRPASS